MTSNADKLAEIRRQNEERKKVAKEHEKKFSFEIVIQHNFLTKKAMEDIDDLLSEVDRLQSIQQERDRLIEGSKKALRVTADGSIPDQWNGSTGGSGHAEVRRIIRSVLREIGVGEERK